MVVQKSRPRPRNFLRDLYAVERKGMAGILRDASPDIVHAHWTYEFELAAQDCGLPHVTTAHDAPVTILRQVRDPYRAARLSVAARARPGIRRLSVVAPYLADRWRREMRYSRPIRIIPNSIPTDSIPPQRTPAPHPVGLEVADAGKRKNVAGLLHAFKIVRGEMPDAELRVVGPGLGPEEPLAVGARSEGMASGVAFLGRLGREELRSEYGSAWVFIHASFEEACPMTLLEAHGAGLPIIGGRDSGGVPYVLDDGRAGTLADVSEPRALSQAILDSLARGPGRPAHLDSIARFASKAVASAYLDWYGHAGSEAENGHR
jgi:glycosyltransferase involved in cell wall biosynthesis